MALKAGVHSILAIPVINKNEPIGLVYAYFTTPPLQNISIDIVDICAKQVAIHIDQSRLHNLVDNFLENVMDLICITNYNGTIQFATQSYCKFLKIDSEALHHSNFNNFNLNNTFTFNDLFIEKCASQKFEFVVTYNLNNTNKIIQWNVTVVAAEKLLIFSGIDITQKLDVANELLQKNNLLQITDKELKALHNNVNEVVFKLDNNGIFLEISSNVADLIGYTSSEMVGQSIISFGHVQDVDRIYEKVINNPDSLFAFTHYKHRVKTKAGTWRWFSTSGQAICNDQNEVCYTIGLSNDINDKYLAEMLRIETGDKYINFFKNQPTPLIVCDLETYNIIEVNEAACKKYGYTKKEFETLSTKALKVEKGSTLFSKYENNGNDKTNQNDIYQQKKKNGELFLAKIKFNQVIINNKIAIICSVEDITYEAKIKDELESGKQIYELYIQQSNDSVYRFETSTPIPINIPFNELLSKIANEFCLVEANEIIATRYGISSLNKLIGLTMKELYKLQKVDYVKGITNFINNNFELINYENTGTDNLGNTFTFLSNIKGQIENGYIVRIWGTSKNITEQKEIQLSLQKSKDEYNNFINNSNDSIFKFKATTLINVNDSYETQINLAKDYLKLSECNQKFREEVNLKDNQLLNEITIAQFIEVFGLNYDLVGTTFIENKYEFKDFVVTSYNKKGERITLKINTKGFIENDILTGLWGTASNISAQTLETEKNNYLANIISEVSDAIYTSDENYTIVSFNNAAEKIYGIKASEAIGKKLLDFINPVYESGSRDKVVEILYKQKKWIGKVTFNRYNDHKPMTLLSTASFITSPTTNKLNYLITSKDITERKATEARILESENRFKNIANNAPVMLWQTDKTGKSVFYSKSLLYYTGLSLKKQLNTVWAKLIHPDDVGVVVTKVNEAIVQQIPIELTYRFKNKQGEYRWILDKAVPRFLPNGEFNGYIGICLDVHDTKAMVEQLQESENRFKDLADQAPVMIWQTDEYDKSIYYSKGWLSYTGNTMEEELSIPWKNKIHENDYEDVVNKYLEAVKLQEPFLLEYRYKNAAGQYLWLLDKGTPRRLPNGRFIGYLGVAIEIENLKQTQENLKIANDKFYILNEATNEAIWESDLITGVAIWGRGYKKLFGHHNVEVKHHNWEQLIHPDDKERVVELFTNFDKKDYTINNIIECEYRFKKADGNYAVVYDVAYIITDHKGKALRMVGSKRDITKQKELETQLISNEVDKQILINKAVIEGQEKEKLELSQELHDNINQLISSSKLYMEVAKRHKGDEDMIQKSIDTLGIAIQEIRRLSKTLNPATINQLKLVDAIEQLIVDIEATGKLTIQFDYEAFDYDITLPQLNLYLYRIVQEQINNILKYAQVSEAQIVLKNNADFLYIKIADNGVGFDTTKKSNGIGLTNIKNRVALFKGQIEITAAPSKGCSIEINIPLHINYF